MDTYIIKRDGEEKFQGNEMECLEWFHRHCSCSADWAVKYEGYTIELVA